MSVDIYSRVLFNDGEQVTDGDLNLVSASARTLLYDQVMVSRVPNTSTNHSLNPFLDPSITSPGHPSTNAIPYAIALNSSAGMPVQGSANNKIKIGKGTLFQALSTPTGTDITFLPFTFDGSAELTIANGDPSHPRVDIIQMALTLISDTPTSVDYQAVVGGTITPNTLNKRSRVQCVLSVKQGTPAASPTYPLADSGNVIIAGIVVGTNYTGAAGFLAIETFGGSEAVLHDQRLPLGVDAVVTTPAMFSCTTGAFTNWNTGNRDALLSTGAAGDLLIPCTNRRPGRLIRVALNSANGAAGISTRLGAYISGGVSYVGPVMLVGNDPGIGAINVATIEHRTQLDEWTHTPAAGPTILSSAAGVGPPLWTNGLRTLGITPPSSNFIVLGLQVLAGAANDVVISHCTFYTAGSV